MGRGVRAELAPGLSPAALRTRLEARLREAGVPGAAVGAARGGALCFRETFGARDRERRAPVTSRTVFGLGSVSKLYTGVLALRLARRVLVSLDDRVARWLPDLAIPGAEGLTLHHLLTHTGGLPPLPGRYHALDAARPGIFDGGNRAVEADALAGPASARAGFADARGLAAWLATGGLEPLAAPGALFSYSNEGYVLLGGALEAAAGAPYAELLGREVLAPLGLARSVVGAAALAELGDDDVAQPWHAATAEPEATDTGGREPEAAPHWDAPAWHAPGGVRASLDDLLAFVSALPGWLGAADFARLSAPHARILSDGRGYGYGIAVVDDHHGHRVLLHDGGRDGLSACAALAPDADLAVAAVANRTGPAAFELCLATLNAALGLPPDAPLWRFAALPAQPPGLRDGAGRYASAENGRALRFGVRDGVLGFESEHGFAPAPATGPDRVLLGAQPLRFLRRASGEVWALAAGERVLRRD